MNLRRRGHADSLELLLNTMCNTFGGIVMISLVMALLSKDTGSESVAQERSSNLRRQIEQTGGELEEARRLQAMLEKRPDASALLALAEEKDRLQAAIRADNVIAQSNNALMAAENFKTNAAPLEQLLARREAESAEARTLAAELEKVKQRRQRALRLPRERVAGKKPFYLIVRYGRVYPISVFRDGQREINTETLTWTTTPGGRSATPIREIPAGAIPPLARLLRDVPAQLYSIHFLVYDDSFPVFINARQLPLQAGFDTGWEFLTEDRPVVFSAGGEAPPAL